MQTPTDQVLGVLFVSDFTGFADSTSISLGRLVNIC